METREEKLKKSREKIKKLIKEKNKNVARPSKPVPFQIGDCSPGPWHKNTDIFVWSSDGNSIGRSSFYNSDELISVESISMLKALINLSPVWGVSDLTYEDETLGSWPNGYDEEWLFGYNLTDILVQIGEVNCE
jgi:hypothetical protein